ncbi:hypothetical protein SprV_0200641500 [Sparganum proliferum]
MTAHNITIVEDRQQGISLFSAECAKFGLIINTNKTAVMNKPPQNALHNSVNDNQIQTVNNFASLRCVLPRSTNIGDEIAHRLFKANQAFVRLQNFMWKRYSVQLSVKLKICKAVVLLSRPYGEEA